MRVVVAFRRTGKYVVSAETRTESNQEKNEILLRAAALLFCVPCPEQQPQCSLSFFHLSAAALNLPLFLSLFFFLGTPQPFFCTQLNCANAAMPHELSLSLSLVSTTRVLTFFTFFTALSRLPRLQSSSHTPRTSKTPFNHSFFFGDFFYFGGDSVGFLYSGLFWVSV